MIAAWRIVREKYAAAACDGEGAAKWGGRWNERGTRVIYTSAHASLAAMELLMHLNPASPWKYVAVRFQFDAQMVEHLADLPGDWRVEPPSDNTKRIGTRWVRESRTVVLAVPSTVVTLELNYLINPLHPDFAHIAISKPEPFAIDSRLLRSLAVV